MTSTRFALALACLALPLSLACPGGEEDAGTSSPDAGIDDAGVDAGLAEGRCRTRNDCAEANTGTSECAPPDAIAFPTGACGACLDEPDQCATDQDCGSGYVCRRQGACGCGELAAICVDGCTSDEECLTGQTCDADAHCVTTSCSTGDDCPSPFDCSAGACARRACSDDGDCEDGACVNSQCFDEAGTCVEVIAVP